MGVGILIFICIWSLVFNAPMFQIYAFYLDFEDGTFMYLSPDMELRRMLEVPAWCLAS